MYHNGKWFPKPGKLELKKRKKERVRKREKERVRKKKEEEKRQQQFRKYLIQQEEENILLISVGNVGGNMKLKFWGVRGSIPAPGPKTVRYGGNTSCVSVESGDDLLVLDGGSGLRELGMSLMGRIFGGGKFNPLKINIFFSHVHWDHIQGVPFFAPLFIKGNEIRMYGEKKARTCLSDTLRGQQQYPNFPITIEEIEINGAKVFFQDLYAGDTIPLDNLKVQNTKLSHPDGVFCYRIENEHLNKAIVYATDTEHRNVLDPRLKTIAKDADVLIYDSQYTPEEYQGIPPPPKFDWGHSTFEWAVDTAEACKVKKLVLFHHDPGHSDEAVDEIEKKAKERAKGKFEVVAAYEGLEIDL